MATVPGSRGLFIVGFERCMTTSLASYLTSAGFAEHLVPGVKEPGIFSADRARAKEIVARRSRQAPGTWLLDASVEYVLSAEALDAIVDTFEDHRILVCLRDQLERTVSAFALYARLCASAVAEDAIVTPPANLRFGSLELRRAARSDFYAPSLLLDPILGRYVFTAIVAKLWSMQAGSEDQRS